MRLPNLRSIRAEDFPTDDQKTISLLGPIINEFMRRTIDIVNGNIGFDNKQDVLKQIRVRVDANGKPISNNTVNIEKSSFVGMQVINAVNLTVNGVTPTSAPFISARKVSGNQVVMDNILGLQANNEYLLTVIIY